MYKVNLALKDPEARDQVDMEDAFDDVIAAKEEYNENMDNGDRIYLLGPRRKRLDILFVPGDPPGAGMNKKDSPGEEHYVARRISEFIRLLCEDYNWEEHVNRESGELFEVKHVKDIEPSACRALMEKLQESRPEYFDPTDYDELFPVKGNSNYRNSLRRGRPGVTVRSNEHGATLYDVTLEEAMEEIGKLQGMGEFKQEIKLIMGLAEEIKKLDSPADMRCYFPYHYIFSYDNRGFGLSTALRLMAILFFNLGITGEAACQETEETDFHPMEILIAGDELGDGIVACHWCELDDIPHDNYGLPDMMETMNTRDIPVKVVVARKKDRSDSVARLKETMDDAGVPYRCIHFSDFSYGEMYAMCRERLQFLGYTLRDDCKEHVTDILKTMQDSKQVYNTRAVERVVNHLVMAPVDLPAADGCDAAVTEWERTPGLITAATTEKLNLAIAGRERKSAALWDKKTDPLTELDNLVGLAGIKKRLREILAHFTVERIKKEAGITGNHPCMHMRFAGNPGTGKTTVARIVGKVLRHRGILRKGELIEVSREDLVGLYVGHTAHKTAAVLNRARGNVLFIDEAYSLFSESFKDFGHEAVATLVKYMEEYREEMVVILAGYPREMEQFISMNPGLSDRIPHKLDFPDYSGEELFRIFSCIIGEDYVLEREGEELLKSILQQAKVFSRKDFSNGRFVRNLAERLKIKQASRLVEENLTGKEDLLALQLQDVKMLEEDEDISRYLKPGPKEIGFSYKQQIKNKGVL